tara:strand:+ start:8542 stop:10272 length:1731 start_codon:yes stop_codon:yes gene_type:complete
MAKKNVKFELTAVDKTKAAFDKVTKGLKGVGGAAATASKGVAGIGLAAAGAAAAIAVLVSKSYDAVDAIGKTATQTGIATDTLQAFHLAARESGTSIEGANTALIKFARSIGDADKGLKTQADIFKDLGVELRDTEGRMRSFDNILEDTAKGITELGSQSERASALANLFGRQGVILTGAITDLSENGIKKFIDRAKELGIVLSEKVIRRTEEFNDAIGVIKMQIGSFVNNITTSFLPIFEKMQKTIADFIQTTIDKAGGMDALGLNIANAIINGVASGIEAFGNFVDSFATFVNDIKIQLKELQIEFAVFQANLLQMNPFKDYGNQVDQLAESVFVLKDEIIVMGLRTTDFGKKAEVTANKVRGFKLSLDDIRDSNKDFNETLKDTGVQMTNIGSPLAVYKAQLEDVGKTMEQIGVKSMKSFEDAIVNGLKTGKLAFKDFASVVVEELIRVAIQQLVIKNLLSMFSLGMSGAEYDSLTDGDTLFNRVPSGNGGGFTGFGSRSGGVDGKGGFPAILHPNETVIDHTQGQGSGGATVNFNISTVDAAGFDQLLASRKGLITQIINNAMNTQGKIGVA